MTEETPSPLTQATPGSLADLMARDPLELTDEDFASIVATFRMKAEEFSIKEIEAAKKSKGKRPSKDVPEDGLTLDVLDFSM